MSSYEISYLCPALGLEISISFYRFCVQHQDWKYLFLFTDKYVIYSFEDGFEGWIQDGLDGGDWIRDNGETPSSYTGPSGDANGYIYGMK